jgi:glycosyltransferase involved in cell wall biosynthesis/predicted metal-dependent phosphoesterase TrpH
MIPTTAARVDLHCHSTASQRSKLGIQRALGLPECATPPEEVYELAKRRGMDFVTITDHDTIEGCLELADRPDVFISEELTTWFRGEPQAVHVLCFGITSEDHAWLQQHAGDLEVCAAYLREREITRALAHPFYAVEAPLQPRHRRRLAELFDVWEVRNGSRAPELNMPAAIYIETHGGTGIAGSDDHAGVDIGRTYTETPPASTPEEFLRHLREGNAAPRGDQGSAAKWAHSAISLATRVLTPDEWEDGEYEHPTTNPAAPGRGAEDAAGSDLDAETVLRMSERVVREGGERRGAVGRDLGPDDARALLRAWLDTVDLEVSGRELIELMQRDDFSHAELYRRARHAHEQGLRGAVSDALTLTQTRRSRPEGAAWGQAPLAAPGGLPRRSPHGGGYGDAIRSLFTSCVPIVPYVPAATFLGREKAKLGSREGDRRVALIVDAAGSMHGVTHTIEQIRRRGVPGYEVEVIGTDPNVDRRLPAAAEIEVPFYSGLGIGVPTVAALVETIAEGRYDLLHLASPGPAGIAAAACGRIGGIPVVGSYHTELATYAALRSGDPSIAQGMRLGLALFYGGCEVVLSPSPASDRSLGELGIAADRTMRWTRGVDTERFDPAKRDPSAYPGEVRVLYAGRLTTEKGVDLLAEAFLHARRRDRRLHLLLAGGGPEEDALRERLGRHATFLGWLEGEDLARAYASADLFLFCSRTDTFGQVILEAQASGLPVVAVDAGGPTSLIRDGESGRLCPPDPDALAAAVLELAASPLLRSRLAQRGVDVARARTWARALEELAGGYARALESTEPASAEVAVGSPSARPAPLRRAA